MPRRVLVTGAGGFVGANVVRRLLSDGHEVHALTRPGGTSWRLEDVEPDVRRHDCDLRDAGALATAMAAARPEWVLHLAAYGAYSWQQEAARIVETNLTATMALLDAALDAGTEAFVHTGSSSEYGAKDHAPSEDELPEPNSPYAVAKAAATMHCRHVSRARDAHAVTLRLYSIYGPWEEPGRLIPTLVEHALRGTLPPLVDPSTARDLVYVDDAVEAIVRAAERSDLERGTVLNLGTGEQRTIADMVAAARRRFGVEEEPRYGEYAARSWDTSVWVADARRIRAQLAWSPRWELEDGLGATADWLRADPERAARYSSA